PFREAINAIHNRSAYRDVDRRLIFIDAKPASIGAARDTVPNFFTTIKGALADLPSDQPIANEITWLNTLNAQVRGIKSIVENARPHVTELVGDVIDKPLDGAFSPDDIRIWRETVNDRVAREAGFAHEGYVRLKMTAVRGFVARTIANIGGVPLTSPLARAVDEIVTAWAI